MILAIGFPNPISWVWDKATGLIGGAASAALGWSFEKVIGGLVAWVLDGVTWVVGAVFGFIDTSTSPDVTAPWFLGDGTRGGPYGVMLGIAVPLLLLFVFAGLIQGVVTGDTAGMARRMLLDLPTAVGGMVATVAITQVLIDLTDAISESILGGFGTDIQSFMARIATVGQLTGGVATALVVFLLGLFALLAALVIFIELVIRSALIYLVVGLCPLAFAALLWPATRGVLRRTLELLCALILSKVVVTLALAIGAAALGGADNEPSPAPGPGLEAPATIVDAGTPEESDAASVTAAAGVLLAGLATFAVACFSPFVLLRLFPMVEGAVVAQGLRSGPMRAAQTAMSTKSQLDISRRFGSGSSGAAAGEGAGGASAAGGAGAGAAAPAAAAGPAVAAVAVTSAGSTAVRTAGAAAERQSSAPGPSRARRSAPPNQTKGAGDD